MGEDKKLTGREAMIAVMQGKKVQRGDRREYTQFWVPEGSDLPSWDIADILAFNDWELVPEPMVQELITKAISESNTDHDDDGVVIYVDEKFLGKRVKVRVEEIL